MRKEKETLPMAMSLLKCFAILRKLDGAGDLAGTQTTGAGIHSLGRAVHNSLNALDVRLPCAVGTTMRVRNPDSESYALTADITFCHDSAPPLLMLY